MTFGEMYTKDISIVHLLLLPYLRLPQVELPSSTFDEAMMDALP